jgi:phosphoglycolate phosphatase
MLIIFDLDGTLIDSAKDLAVSMNAMREHLGMPALDPALIYSFIGDGAAVLVRRAIGAGATDELVEEGLSFFLKYYRTHALEHTQLYPGVRELLDTLAGKHKLAILTNKPVKISFDILGALGLGAYFQQVYGGDSFAGKKPDPVGIRTLMTENATAPNETWMVGDSSVDIQTARNAGVRSCGVSWGFQPGSFETTPPDVLIHSPGELERHLERVQ